MNFCKKRLLQLVLFITALQVLNMSIGPSDAREDAYDSDNSLNRIDTYFEYIAEVIFQYENAIPELGKPHQKQWQQHRLHQVICDIRPVICNQLPAKTVKQLFISLTNEYAFKFFKEISPPPERNCCFQFDSRGS